MLQKTIFSLIVCCGITAVGNAAIAAVQVKTVSQNAALPDAAIKHFDSGDRAGAFPLLKKFEKSGDLRILSRLGWCYFIGSGVKENRVTGYEYFKRSVDDPDGFGIDGLAACYAMGVGVKQDFKKAESLHKKALAMGNAYAAGNLAILYGKMENKAKELQYWEISYKSKLPPFRHALSAFMLGCLHDDPKVKLSCLEDAAKHGYYDALLELAKLYNFGGVIEVNMPKALEYAKIYSEKTGDKKLYGTVAFDWAIEKMFLRDFEIARKYMLISADHGNKQAYWYAYLLSNDGKYALAAAESGDERGCAEAAIYLQRNQRTKKITAEDQQKAIKFYQIAIERQDDDSLNALCNLAAVYAAKQDIEGIRKSLELYQKAARWQSPRGLRGAGLIYAIYSNRSTTEENKKIYARLALEHIAAAIFASDKTASNFIKTLSSLADKYSDTAEAKFFKGVKLIAQMSRDKDNSKSTAEAIKLIKNAADNGCIQAITFLGICASEGVNLPEDYKAAAEYLRKSAEAGNFYTKMLLASDRRFFQYVPLTERVKYLKELIASGSKGARSIYARILESQGKFKEAEKEYRANIAAGHVFSMVLLHDLLMQQNNKTAKEEAYKLLSKAIEKNNGPAQCIIGMKTIDSPNIYPRWSMHLVMKGVIDSGGFSDYYMHHIAINYAFGKGVTKSADNARKIAKLMIDNGYPYGFYTLGLLCQSGALGKVDKIKAAEFYKKGAAQGIQECAEALKRISSTGKQR